MGKAKIHILTSATDGEWISFWCVGCRQPHAMPIVRARPAPARRWFFDGNMQAPTIEPSLRVMKMDGVSTDCHVVITAGMLNYCADSVHRFAGHSVPMVDWDHENWWGDDKEPASPPPPDPARPRKVVVTYGVRT